MRFRRHPAGPAGSMRESARAAVAVDDLTGDVARARRGQERDKHRKVLRFSDIARWAILLDPGALRLFGRQQALVDTKNVLTSSDFSLTSRFRGPRLLSNRQVKGWWRLKSLIVPFNQLSELAACSIAILWSDNLHDNRQFFGIEANRRHC